MRFIPLLILVLLLSCGDDVGENSNRANDIDQEEQTGRIENFHTRLDPQLAVIGTQCIGGETTGRPDNSTRDFCDPGEWLIELDQPNGVSSPIIVELIPSARENHFRMEPESAVTAGEQLLLSNLLIRVEDNGQAEVIRDTETPLVGTSRQI